MYETLCGSTESFVKSDDYKFENEINLEVWSEKETGYQISVATSATVRTTHLNLYLNCWLFSRIVSNRFV